MSAKLSLAEQQAIKAQYDSIKSRRGKILKSLELHLKTIDPSSRPNYSHKIRTVDFDVSAWKDIQEANTPAVYIVDGVADIRRFPTVTRNHKWVVTLFGVCKRMNMFQFEEHIADVQECLEKNHTLAQTISKLEVLKVITDNQLFSVKTNTHLYSMDVELDFIQKFGDPKSGTC